MNEMNAVEMLEKDHEQLRDLLGQLTSTTTRAEKKRQELLEKIEKALMVHTKIEERVFYPAFHEAGNKEHAAMFFEALEEHRAVEKLVLPDLKATDPTSDQFSGRAKVLKELIEHHAEEEEEDMFPAARKLLSDDELKSLGQQMQSLRKQLMQELKG